MNAFGRRVGRAIAGTTVLACVACSEPADPRAATITDSAGIQVVYSSIPSWTQRDALTISDLPRVDIGGDPTDSASLLYRVVGVVVLPDGRLFIANLGDNTLRLHAASGELLQKFGGRGEGPGQFRQLRGLIHKDGELWAYQSMPMPTNVFDLNGNYLRQISSPPVSGPRLHGFLADGSVIVTAPRSGTGSRMWLDSAALISFNSGSSDTIAILPARRRIEIDGIGAESQALGPFLEVVAADSTIYASFPDGWDISLWQRGRLVRRIRREYQAVPVTDAHEAAYGEMLTQAGGDDAGLTALYRKLADGMVYPQYHPAHARMLIDASGRLWVEHPQTEPPWSEAIDYSAVRPTPTTWDVFSTTGVWLGAVDLPARFRVLEIGVDYIAGVAKDVMDVERVQVWDLHSPVR